MNEANKKITMNLGERSYDIHIGSGILRCADKFMNLKRRVLIVTDSGVPEEYAKTVKSLCEDGYIYTFPEGEENKNLNTYSEICKQLLTLGFQRKDAVVAVGGGVTGDMAGFAAATYMRGIDFYNIPTTLLSQVDSSIGGKCAVDFLGVKNILGAFYQPRSVLIDVSVLNTLDKRQLSAGLAEVTKMALTSDAELFSLLENGLYESDLSEVIARALSIKQHVVEMDEREGSIRRILNFGHTFGHGIEALGDRLHGECVALGMIPMCSPEVQARLVPLLRKMNLPTEFGLDIEKAIEFMLHDKKGDGDSAHVIFVDKIGTARIEKMKFSAISSHIKNAIGNI